MWTTNRHTTGVHVDMDGYQRTTRKQLRPLTNINTIKFCYFYSGRSVFSKVELWKEKKKPLKTFASPPACQSAIAYKFPLLSHPLPPQLIACLLANLTKYSTNIILVCEYSSEPRKWAPHQQLRIGCYSPRLQPARAMVRTHRTSMGGRLTIETHSTQRKTPRGLFRWVLQKTRFALEKFGDGANIYMYK